MPAIRNYYSDYSILWQPNSKSLSKLYICDGFIHGWAFDSNRPLITAVLSINNEALLSSPCDRQVDDRLFAINPPPSFTCGFALPIPITALDGRSHKLTVSIKEWQALPCAPTAVQTWHFGHCFGETEYTPATGYQGWVAFHDANQTSPLPPVLVILDGVIQFAIELTPCSLTIANKDYNRAGKFTVDAQTFAYQNQIEFKCLDMALELKLPKLNTKLAGCIESIQSETGITGWALDFANPHVAIDLLLIVDDQPLFPIRPNVKRHDIAKQLGLFEDEIGICGFHIALPPSLKDGETHSLLIANRKSGKRITTEPVIFKYISNRINLDSAYALLEHPKPIRAKSLPESLVINKPITTQPLVSVIILNRNGEDCLPLLFESWLNRNTTPVELIIIDHASRDNSIAIINNWTKRLPIQLVTLDYNDSFSASCNRGAQLAQSPAVLFLNNDIVWLQDALPQMLDTLASPNVGAVGLKLLKSNTSFNTSSPSASRQEVQHLGVRFKLVAESYWPYETTTDNTPDEDEHNAVDLAVVTGAVMLCRRDDFLATKGFDEGFVYGFEDVEFCLRMKYRHNKSIICRNDLVALHHHGYTRLTGREPSMLDHQIANQKHLNASVGLWLKRAFWKSLLNNNNALTLETLTIGFIVDQYQLKATQQLQEAVALSEIISEIQPDCRFEFLEPNSDWYNIADWHVLIALNPYYDLRMLKQYRSDVKLAFYISTTTDIDSWKKNPSLHFFQTCLCKDKSITTNYGKTSANFQPPLLITPTVLSTHLFNPDVLRVCLIPDDNESYNLANEVAAQLSVQGISIDIHHPNARFNRRKVIDISLHIIFSELNVDTVFETDTYTIAWLINSKARIDTGYEEKIDELWLASGHLEKQYHYYHDKLKRMPCKKTTYSKIKAHLEQAIEAKLGRTFHTP